MDATRCPADIAYPQDIELLNLYRNRAVLAFCKGKGIRLTGPALGRPPKGKELNRQAKEEEH